ncbi:hypothetical protein EJB05_04699 [Eragrostis curvula]|uniref:Glyceraldehyde 3-phosphate dehydrogenase NAD(P) binding domain-containing protein n=1 Tax=Eragrostis curvula TaxID=38414 RepID=A0A5J9WB67_9POAL|nr:hypothetical protein EJB05_04699 [Eragrostis curvula]
MSSDSPASASTMPAPASFSEQRVRVLWPYNDCVLIRLERLEKESLVQLEVRRKLLRAISVGETLTLDGLGLWCNCSVDAVSELADDQVRIDVRALDHHVYSCYECEYRGEDGAIPVGSFSDRMVGKAMRFCGSVPEIVSQAVVQDVKRKDSLFCAVRLEFLPALPLLMGDLLVLESMDGQCQWEAYVVGFGDSTFLVGDTKHVIVHVHNGQDIPLKMLPPFKCVFVDPMTSSTSIRTDNSGKAAFDKANKAPLDEAENRAKAKIKIGINGYGSFGRAAAKIALNSQDVELVAINEPKVMMDEMTCLFRDKKIHGQWLRSDFKMKDHNTLMFGEKEVTLFRIEEGNDIPWNMTGAEYIVAAYTDESGYDYYKIHGVLSKSNQEDNEALPFCSAAPGCASLCPVTASRVTRRVDVTAIHLFGRVSAGARAADHIELTHATSYPKEVPGVSCEKLGFSRFNPRFGTAEDVSVDCWVAVLKIKPQNKHAAKAIQEVLPQWKGKPCGLIFKVPAVDIAIELDQYMDHGLLLSSIKPSFGFSTLLGWCVEMARQLPEVRYCELKFK